MRLSELMSEMGLAAFPQLALVIFLAVFVGVCIRTFSAKRRSIYEQIARIPLTDEPTDHRSERSAKPHRQASRPEV